MNYSMDIVNEIKAFLQEEEWTYSFDEKTGIFRMGANLKCKLGTVDIIVKVGADYFTTYAGVRMSADEPCRQAVAEFIARANYGMRNGNFELNFADGEIRYKSYNNCDGIMPSKEMIADGIMIPALMLDRYGNGLLAVMFGIRTPEEALNECEENWNQS